jgi:hypothetical protein
MSIEIVADRERGDAIGKIRLNRANGFCARARNGAIAREFARRSARGKKARNRLDNHPF